MPYPRSASEHRLAVDLQRGRCEAVAYHGYARRLMAACWDMAGRQFQSAARFSGGYRDTFAVNVLINARDICLAV
jgi:hypothetical protein